jgi:hypothetical protein
MTNEELLQAKQDIRKARLKYIAKVVALKQLGETDSAIKLDALEDNLFKTLCLMAEKRGVLLEQLFRMMQPHAGLPHEENRVNLRYVCRSAHVRLPLALFDSGTGHMRAEARNSSNRSVRSYVNDMLSCDDSDDVQDVLDEYFDTCPDCGEWEARGHFSSTYNADDVCRACLDNHYEYSDYYDTYVYSDDSRTAIDRDGDEVTIHYDDDNFSWNDDEDCYVHHEYAGRIIASYHSSKGNFTPISSAWTKANSFYISKIVDINNPPPRLERYFGVELEVEVKHGDRVGRAEAINDAVNDGKVGKFCFFENDGSLTNGFEIITQPMGLDMHTSFWQWVNNADLSRGLLSHNTSSCGLHVHVTRMGLSRLQLSKMVAFVNHPDNQPLLEAIARRYGSNYARFHSSKRIGNALRSAENRYEALNLESRKTVEVRIFKGSLKYESIMSAVEFTNALVNFCSDQSGYGFKLDTKSFLSFINNTTIANDTKHLRPYLANKLESQ